MRSGKKANYNPIMKMMCWRLAKALIRAKGSYYEYYRDEKDAIVRAKKAEGLKIVPSEELPLENGKHKEKDGLMALGHVDMMAQRKMIKLFLSHLWEKWREAEGLPISKPYIHAIGGHSDYRDPDSFVDS